MSQKKGTKHKYPKSRKSRNTDNTSTGKLIKQFGIDGLYDIWVKYNGMYKSADYLSEQTDYYVSPYIVRYLSDKYNWVRTITDKSLPIFKGYLNGNIPKGFYRHIIFKED